MLTTLEAFQLQQAGQTDDPRFREWLEERRRLDTWACARCGVLMLKFGMLGLLRLEGEAAPIEWLCPSCREAEARRKIDRERGW